MRVTASPPLPSPSPVQLGYRMPAEWEPHQGTWLTWPHCEETWPGKVEAVVPAYVEAIRALSRGETVHVNTLHEDHRATVEATLRAAGIPSGPGTRVQLHIIPTDDEWIRDYGALLVVRDGGLAATNWLFNAWGEKYDRVELNNTVPVQMAEYLNIPVFECPIVMEGGSIDVNGRGVALTTEACLLNPNRNPGLVQHEIEHWLYAGLGIREVLWLGEGIVGDDTDGHIDDLTRFVAPDTVVTIVNDDPSDPDYEPLRDNRDRLASMTLQDGSGLHVVELPTPAPVHHNGERLPASYANFLIGNAVVLLPTFDDPKDSVAQTTLQGLFPGREVVGIDARDIVWGLGAFHCLSQQIPAIPASE